MGTRTLAGRGGGGAIARPEGVDVAGAEVGKPVGHFELGVGGVVVGTLTEIGAVGTERAECGATE